MTLMNHSVRDEILKFKEKEIFFHGILHTLGFKKKSILIEKKFKGKSEYTVSKKFNLFFDAITSFSGALLKLFFYLGLGVSFFSAFYALMMIIKYFALQNISSWFYYTCCINIIFWWNHYFRNWHCRNIYTENFYRS